MAASGIKQQFILTMGLIQVRQFLILNLMQPTLKFHILKSRILCLCPYEIICSVKHSRISILLFCFFLVFLCTSHPVYERLRFPVGCSLVAVRQWYHHILSTAYERPGPGCSKLTTLLVNVSLKFQMLLSQIFQYFLLKKCEGCSRNVAPPPLEGTFFLK